MIDAVVKVGGSLGHGASLPELGARLVELGRSHRLLVVPGGGAFADGVAAAWALSAASALSTVGGEVLARSRAPRTRATRSG